MFLISMKYVLQLTIGFDLMIVSYAVFILMLFHYVFIVFRKKSVDVDCIYLLFLIPFYLISSSRADTIYVVLGCLILKEYSLKAIVQASVIVQLVVLLFYLLLMSLNVFPVFEYVRSNGLTYYTLGFINPNSTASFLFGLIIICSLFFRLKKYYHMMFSSSVVLGLCFLLIFLITGCRTYSYGLIFYLLFSALFGFCKKVHFKRIFLLFPFLLFVFILLLPYYLSFELDRLFSGRLAIFCAYLNEFDFKKLLFGRPLHEGAFDNSFLMLLFNGGIVSVIFFLSTYFRGIKNSSNAFLKKYLPFLLVMLLIGLCECSFSGFGLLSMIFYRILYENKFKKNLVYEKHRVIPSSNFNLGSWKYSTIDNVN